jgi:hypothetical protein
MCPAVLFWPLRRSASKQPDSGSGRIVHESNLAGSYIRAQANWSSSN